MHPKIARMLRVTLTGYALCAIVAAYGLGMMH